MKIKFYGVRGSLPTPGKHTTLFGGNTSCVYVELTNGENIILDAGTGIIELGKKLALTTDDITILLTHNHWDHIQGFPFFAPIHQTGRSITLVPGAIEHQDQDLVLTQMSGSGHPVKYQQLAADIHLQTDWSKQESFTVQGFSIKTMPLNHPDGGSAYCLYADGKKLAYVTDNELIPPSHAKTSWQQWLAFIADADILIHDAQYNNDDMPHKHGWGHSTYRQVLQLAIDAKVKQLFTISHDPSRTDQDLLSFEASMQKKCASALTCYCAREGVIIDLGSN